MPFADLDLRLLGTATRSLSAQVPKRHFRKKNTIIRFSGIVSSLNP
jgi:hypothetical protein